MAPARKVFWRLVRERAGSPQAIRDAFAEAGHDLTDSAVTRWIRGETDPGWEVTLWASRRWAVSIDELGRDQEAQALRADRLGDLELRTDVLWTWAIQDQRFQELLSQRDPEQRERLGA